MSNTGANSYEHRYYKDSYRILERDAEVLRSMPGHLSGPHRLSLCDENGRR